MRLRRLSARLAGSSSPAANPDRLGIDFHFLDVALGLGPAFLPDQGHEGHGAEILLLEAVLRRCGERASESDSRIAHGDDQAAADGKLLLQRFGNMRAAGGNDDGLEGCLLRQALGAVGDNDLDIAIA